MGVNKLCYNIKSYLFSLIVLLLSANVYSQVRAGLVIGTNFSKFQLEKIDTPYPDPMSINAGFNIRGLCSYQMSNRFNISTEFGYSYMDSKANKQNNRISYYIDIPLYVSYQMHNRIEFSGGLIYQRLLKFLIGGWGKTADLTSLTTNRDFFNPYVGVNFYLKKRLGLRSEFVYSIKDTYLASASDFNGIDTPPLKAKRHFFTIMLFYKW